MKMVVKRKKKKHILLNLLVIIIIGIFCAFLLIKYFSKNISPFFMTYAEDEIRRLATLVINYSINDDIFDELNDDKIFDIVKKDNDDIQLISYNAKNVNILLNSIAIMVQNNLKAIEDGDINFLNLNDSFFSAYDGNLLKQGIVCEVPFGVFFNNSLISNVGPKIPIRFNLLGDVDTKINTTVKEYGINNALLDVSIDVFVNIRVNLPFVSNKIKVSSSIPISMKIIQGNIPEFYNGMLQSSFGTIKSFYDV